jgi:hypothetical protein
MMLFSRRTGLRPAQKALQVDGIDDELRKALWSMFFELVLKGFEPASRYYPARGDEIRGSNLESLFFAYWFDLYEEPTDTIPERIERGVTIVRDQFFRGDYGHVYDFLEVTLQHTDKHDELQGVWNAILERHNSAYRLVDGTAAKITSDVEIAAIETALDVKLRGVRTHLHSALAKLADRKTPDYRNSVKESISAVESLAQSVTGNSSATLGDALKILAPALGLHGAFRDALSKLYGFTSDADGIRHAILDDPNVTYGDAMFMLVVCSAFVNYLISNAAEGKITFRTS